ncbi:glycosyltransferase [Glycomyces tarimensis]
MRVLLSTFGSRGDVTPVIGLAAELRSRGAEVRVCAPPDAEFTRLAAGVGAAHVPIGQSVRDMLARITPGSRKDASRLAAELVAMQLETRTAASGCDALVATGLLPAGAREVAEQLDIPYRFAAFAPGVLPSPNHPPLPRPGKPYPPGADNQTLWDIDAQNANALYGEALNAHRASAGLPPVDNVRDHVLTDRPWLATDPVLAPWPGAPDLDVVQTGAWFAPDERPLPAELDTFLDAGEPPVYVGFGSMPPHVLQGTAEAAIAAVRAHGRRVLLSGGWAGLALDGEDCLTVGETNHRALFPRVAAVVHHGGAGTTATAARAGAPQVLAPQMGDQPYWAGRVTALGIGAAIDDQGPTAASLTAALATALDPATRARASSVADQIRTDGAATAATLLLERSR